jgi:hypothetical protein
MYAKIIIEPGAFNHSVVGKLGSWKGSKRKGVCLKNIITTKIKDALIFAKLDRRDL